jgi:t-SNARE complex subunit (syntaxin)
MSARIDTGIGAGIELTPLRSYREQASYLLNKMIHEVSNYSIPFPQRKAAFLVIVSSVKSLLMHLDKTDYITKKTGKGLNEIMRELERKEGENIDDYMERTSNLLIEILSEIAVTESVVYPNLGANVW